MAKTTRHFLTYSATILLIAGMTLRGTPAPGAGVLPGLQPDGTMLLHNQWPIRPVGTQVPAGDFPVALAVDPQGRFAAVLNAGTHAHSVRVISLASGTVIQTLPIHETYAGLAFSRAGDQLACSGGSDGVVHLFAVSDRGLDQERILRVADPGWGGVVGGVAFSPDGRSLLATGLLTNDVFRIDLKTGRLVWRSTIETVLDGQGNATVAADTAPNDVLGGKTLLDHANPLQLVWDETSGRAYVTEWGRSAVAVLDLATGRRVDRWACGLHPNELVLGRDGRLFVSNGGANTVSVFDTHHGRLLETLATAIRSTPLPGVTPDSLTLSPDGRTLYVANAYTNNVAVFSVADVAASRALGFLPTGWFPTGVRLSPDGRHAFVLTARGLEAKPDSPGWKGGRHDINSLYEGSLALITLGQDEAFRAALAEWTAIAESLHPVAAPVREPGHPIPAAVGQPSPIRYVIYIIKENRTYDQVLGDLPQGNGDPSICLFPEAITPNSHALARRFVLLDNLYANAEVSASGHEWSMAGYSSEFVEKSWPVEYGHRPSNVPYPAEGHFKAAVPALGYLWDQAAAAGVTYCSYGEFVTSEKRRQGPVTSNLPALAGHVDPSYEGWNLAVRDVTRAARFIEQLHHFETTGDMPRLQILRLPQDHTEGGKAKAWTPAAMVADNDWALGQIVEAVSHSSFWARTAIFVIEDDAQSGPDHVDAHRTVGFAISPYIRPGTVDSAPYTTCSMLRTIELILGLQPMSQFDGAAAPLVASFRSTPDLTPYVAVRPTVDMDATNPAKTPAAKLSARMDFSREDRVEDRLLTRAVWKAVRGSTAEPPAPVHAAFVRSLPASAEMDDD